MKFFLIKFNLSDLFIPLDLRVFFKVFIYWSNWTREVSLWTIFRYSCGSNSSKSGLIYFSSEKNCTGMSLCSEDKGSLYSNLPTWQIFIEPCSFISLLRLVSSSTISVSPIEKKLKSLSWSTSSQVCGSRTFSSSDSYWESSSVS